MCGVTTNSKSTCAIEDVKNETKIEDGFSVSLRGKQDIRFWRPVIVTEWIEEDKVEIPIYNE